MWDSIFVTFDWPIIPYTAGLEFLFERRLVLKIISSGGRMGDGFKKCNRCGGMMIYEKIYCMTEQIWVWKCVYCGEHIDRVVLENRGSGRTISQKVGMSSIKAKLSVGMGRKGANLLRKEGRTS